MAFLYRPRVQTVAKLVLGACALYLVIDFLDQIDRATRLQVRQDMCRELNAWDHPACDGISRQDSSGPPYKF